MARVTSPDPNDPASHQRAIRSLASELGAPPEKVSIVYEHELKRVQVDARVTPFVVVFARKGTRECLICAGQKRMAKCAAHARCPIDIWNESQRTPTK
jgi:hypothetical protein